MKRNSVVFLLTSIFIIKVNSLTAQEQFDLTPIEFTQEDFYSDSVELRKFKIKISASKVLQGLATACICIANVVGAKNKKERQESTYTAISSAFQIAADACVKHKKQPKEKQDQEIQVNTPENASTGTVEQLNSETPENTSITKESKFVATSETKSVNFGYLQQIQDLSTEQEKMDLIDKILQNQQTTEILLDEVNLATKLILIDALFDN
ncbi:MAG: hypothetical protein WC192_05895 [Candidatus Babeliales bacterium]|jgi:hypothetical protein